MEKEEDNSLDVYQFRRRKARHNQLLSSNYSFPKENISESDRKNDAEEQTNEKCTKTYAILQETRTDFNNSKLRALLLIYSTSAWTIFILTMLMIAYHIDTTIYAFCRPHERPFWAIMILICCNFIFIFDVIIIVGLKFFKKWRKTLNLMEPNTFLVVLDVILAFPYCLLYLLKLDVLVFDSYAFAPLIAIIRIYRIPKYFYNKSTQAGKNQWTTFLFQYLILFIMSVHTWTCVWYLFANKSFDVYTFQSSWSLSAIFLPTEVTLDWYFVCTYWSVMYLTTNALGDLYPVTTVERLIGISATLVGFLLTTVVFVGSLTSLFITITTRRSKYVRQLNQVKNHLRLIKMDSETTSRIIRYYEDLWYQKSGVFKPKLLAMLPYPLQMEICYDLNAVPLYSSLIFRKLPEAFLRRLSLNMTHQFFLPGDVVYSHNQNKTIMVCVTNGVLELLSDEDDESPMISFAKGTCFGEISLVYNVPARCTVKAATYVECQVLEKTKFIKLMITYPDLVESITDDIKERLQRAKLRKRILAEQTEFSLNIYASKGRKKSNIKCLKDKLRYLQGKIDINPLTQDDYLDEHCLDLYILSEHVKKKTSKFTCLQSRFPWMLEAECPLVKYWELYMLAIVFYVCIVYPYYIGFARFFPDRSLYAEIIIIISLILNLLITSITAVKTKKKYITDFRSIISYRMNTLGFYLDLIAIIPFEHIMTVHTSVTYHDNYRDHLFYLCKGVKLCLVWRVSSFFENLERKLMLNTIVVKVFKYYVYITLLCYWCGVILFMESCFVNRCSENSWFNRALIWDSQNAGSNSERTDHPLVTSIYFATTILLSVGYGDFVPGDIYDMAFVAFLSLYGVLLSGYCVSEFSSVVTHWSRTKTAFLEVIMTIDKFMTENNMHPAIKSRIMAFYELQWLYNSGVELTDENWLENTVVPSELRKKVLHQARFKALTSIKFFQVKNKAYIQTLTETATDIILPPGEIVFYGGTVTRELYIIESGYCLVTSAELRATKKEQVIGPGNNLGLLVLLYGVPSVSTVVTLTHCKLISVSHCAYTSALSLFPDMKEHEGLITPAELKTIEMKAKSLLTDSYLQHYNRIKESKTKTKITNILQDFFNNSFINVMADYKKNNVSYWKSYKNYKVLNNIAPYILMPIIIKPDGIFLKAWAAMRIAVAFLLCLMIPIIVSMAPLFTSFNVSLLFLEILCYIDMYLMLHVAYYGTKNQLIYHPYMTAKHYLKGQFVVDILTCFPWYALWMLFVPKHDEGHRPEDHAINKHLFHCAIRLINVLQIVKLYSASWSDSIGALKRAYIMSVLHFLLLTLFFLNLYASILITLSCRYVKASDSDEFDNIMKRLSENRPYIKVKFNPNGNMVCHEGSWLDGSEILKAQAVTPSKVYLLAYYWAATSFSGAGFGDIVPRSMIQMILCVCVNIHGVLFFGYVYARIASLKALADQVVTKFQENLKHLELFLNREKVPLTLRKTILEYWKYQWKRTGGWSHQSILGKLHANLNEDAVLHMYEKTLREIPLFEDVEYSFFRAFAKNLRERYFQKGYLVIRSNEVIATMYIIYRGKVNILSNSNEGEVCMGPGGIFGNIKGANKYLTMSNVVASRNIDLLCMEGHDFYTLLKSYPSVLNKVMKSVQVAQKDYVLPTMCQNVRSSLDPSSFYDTSYETGEEDEEDSDVLGYADSPEKSIADSHSRSITSATGAGYTHATLLLFKPHRWFRSSIIPDCGFITFMEYLILFLSYVDFVLLVYQMTFMSVPYFLYICILFDLIFTYKVFLDLHSGYMNRYGEYVMNPRKVRKMFFLKTYLRRRDFLSILPICYFVLALPLKPEIMMSMFSYTRAPQLARITYLFTYRTHKKTHIGSANLLFKLTTIAIWASILSHVNACLFFKLSCMTHVHCTSNNWMSKPELNLRAKYSKGDYFALYVTALWYMINLLTITGTGDVTAQNSFEVIETVVIIVIIKFCTGLLISEMSAMITAHSSSRIAYDYDINELRDGLKDMDLSLHQMNKMWDYVRELWNRQQGKQMPELIYKLPFRLRCQLMEAVYGSHIKESVIFSKTDDDFMRMLTMWMRHCVFFPGNYIVQCGDSDQCIYFIHRGQVEVLTVHPNLTESIFDILEPEDSFGIAQGLFVGVAHHFSFRARTVVDIVYLKLDQWKYLLDYYPRSAKIVRRKVENVYLAI